MSIPHCTNVWFPCPWSLETIIKHGCLTISLKSLTGLYCLLSILMSSLDWLFWFSKCFYLLNCMIQLLFSPFYNKNISSTWICDKLLTETRDELYQLYGCIPVNVLLSIVIYFLDQIIKKNIYISVGSILGLQSQSVIVKINRFLISGYYVLSYNHISMYVI